MAYALISQTSAPGRPHSPARAQLHRPLFAYTNAIRLALRQHYPSPPPTPEELRRAFADAVAAVEQLETEDFLSHDLAQAYTRLISSLYIAKSTESHLAHWLYRASASPYASLF